MTEGHGVPEKVFLQCSLVIVQGVFLLFEVLLDETSPVVVEVFKDTVLALPPLSIEAAEHLIQKTKIYTALKGYRGKPTTQLAKLYEAIARFSELVSKIPDIEESDINPLCLSDKQLIALDARIVLKKH